MTHQTAPTTDKAETKSLHDQFYKAVDGIRYCFTWGSGEEYHQRLDDLIELAQDNLSQSLIKQIEELKKKPGRLFIPIATTKVADPDVGHIYNQAIEDLLTILKGER